VFFAVLLIAVIGGSFSEHATRALFMGTANGTAAFASVGNVTDAVELGALATQVRSARRLIGTRRSLQGVPTQNNGSGPVSGLPEILTPLQDGTGQDAGLGAVSSAPGAAAVPRQLALSNPANSPLVGSGANQLPATDGGPTPPAVPEPPAWALGVGGLACLGAYRHFRRSFKISVRQRSA